MRIFASCCVLMLLLAGSPRALNAQPADQFITSQSIITADNTAPSVPSGVVASAASDSQIDISWSASTDDIAVTGYQVFRNNVQIATTTLLAYADTGLTPETLYAYNITAFDQAGNISARSATTTATTEATFVPPSGGGNPTVYAVPRLSDLVVVPDLYSASISWETSIPTRSKVHWGFGEEYELATLVERSLRSHHATKLTELAPGTRYYFKIVAYDKAGNETVLIRDSFMTMSLPDEEPPENVAGFTGYADGKDAILTWQNPNDPDFDRVRIVRRTDGYPVDPADGFVVFEGTATEYRDTDIFEKGKRAYYAAFAYDKAGNVSSGALVAVAALGEVVPPPVEVPLEEGIAPLEFRNIIFLQENKEISFIGNDVEIDGGIPFEMRIPYGLLPEHLKTVMVTLKPSSDSSKSFSFLLRINKDKTAYTAKIGALGEAGEYPIVLMLLDYAQQSVSKVEGTLIVKKEVTSLIGATEPTPGLVELLSGRLNLWIIAFMLMILLLALYATGIPGIRSRGTHETR